MDYKILFSQVIRFMDKFHRFPRFVKVGKEIVEKDDIILIYKHIADKDLMWYKGKVCRVQLCDVIKELKCI